MGRENLAAICYVDETSDLSIEAMTPIAYIEGWRYRKWCQNRGISRIPGTGGAAIVDLAYADRIAGPWYGRFEINPE